MNPLLAASLLESLESAEQSKKADHAALLAVKTADDASKKATRAVAESAQTSKKLAEALGKHSKTLNTGLHQAKQAHETAQKASASASEASRIAARAETRAKTAEDAAYQATGATKEQNKRLSGALNELVGLSSDVAHHATLLEAIQGALSDTDDTASKALELAEVRPKAGKDGEDGAAGVGIEDIRDVRHGPDDHRLTMFLTDGRTFDLSKLTETRWEIYGGGNALGTSGGSTTIDVHVTAVDYTVTTSNDVVIGTAACTITLPTAVGSTKTYRIKRSGAGAVTVATNGAETIDGASDKILNVNYASIDVHSDGANWVVL